MKVSIVIVSWNVCEELIGCLRSIMQHPPRVPYEMLVVDNHSTDHTADRIRREFPQVRLFVNQKNLGFAAANNIGIREAVGEYVLFLNPDTLVLENSLDPLLAFSEDCPGIGICAPKLLNADGSLQESVRAFPTFRAALYRYTFFQYFGLFRSHYHKWMARQFDYSQPQEVDQVMGAAMLIPKRVLDKVGVFDESFFMYYEEVDLCFRIRNCGWKVFFFPGSEMVHLGGSSSDQIPDRILYMRLCSLLKFFRKHHKPIACHLFSVLLKAGLAVKIPLDILTSGILFTLSKIIRDQRRLSKNYKKFRNAASFLFRYYTKLLFQ